MHDVIVVGAGPNGLMIACELALAGVSPLVLERHAAPVDEQRANGLVGQVVRMLDRRGLHERLAGSTGPPQPVPGFVFGALPLDLRDVPDNPLYMLPVPQRRIEEVLNARAAELGVEVRRGHEVTGFTQDGGAVHVTLADGAVLSARRLVGADGGRSAVRRLAGIDFPGSTNDRAVSRTVSVSVPPSCVDASGALVVPGYGTVTPFRHTRTEHGLVVWAPFPGRAPGLSTVEWGDAPADDVPMTLAEMRESATRVLGAEVPIGPPQGDGPHLMRRLRGGNTRLADRYRAGRVFLIGDAAHVHSAMGGPGLNLGLQDAVNLGWKLAAVLRGWAPEALLDTYEAERRPAAVRVTVSTQAQSALIAPGGDVSALRTLFAELLTDPHTTARVAALMAGADLVYDTVHSGPPPTGRFAPNLTIGGTRLAELTRTARPLLLDSTGTLAAVAAPWRDRVDVVEGAVEGTDAPALLLRPDTYVAWAGDDAGSLREALLRWCGSPETAVSRS
jgi:2-polyprenyl-6-methoxyphenol hydroxylase-like FAD-dependent oxidoreductase